MSSVEVTHLLEDILDRYDNRVLSSPHAAAKSMRAPDSDAIAACSNNFRWRVNLNIIRTRARIP